MIAADGEMRASKALREASQIIEQSPAALQLRYLQVRLRAPPVRYGLLLLRFIDNVFDRFILNIGESNCKFHLNLQILKNFQYFQYIYWITFAQILPEKYF